jgi:hypothetical protein
VYKKYPRIEKKVCTYNWQILHGLGKCIHDCSIIHMDIICKPFGDGSGVVKLVGLEMLKEIDRLNKLLSCKGNAQ